MTADERGFLATILAEPDDNTHRLVYADWMDEHGTTDQQKARSEWIRMTCWDRGKRASRPTGEQTRMAGEPAWLRANARRLWPNLFAIADGTNMPVRIGLGTGYVELSLPVRLNKVYFDSTVVNLAAERGVTRFACVTFVRAGIVAPAAAADEPAAAIRFQTVPDRCYVFAGGFAHARWRAFNLRGLTGVWNALGGERSDVAGEAAKAVAAFNGTTASDLADVDARINQALTAWARTQAANSLAFGGDAT